MMFHKWCFADGSPLDAHGPVESFRSVVAVRRIACRVMGLQSFCPRMEAGQWAICKIWKLIWPVVGC